MASVSLEVDIRTVAQSKCMLVIYDEKLVTSVFVEAGAAIALGKPLVVYAQDKDTLPFLLRESSQELAYAMHEYAASSEIAALVRKTRTALFPRRSHQ